MGRGVQRIVDVLRVAKSTKEVAAVVVPRSFAKRLGEELYPLREMRTWDIPAMDRVNELEAARVRKDRDAWEGYIRSGGYIGTVFDVPFFVLEDVVICALSREELEEYARVHGFDAGEAVRPR